MNNIKILFGAIFLGILAYLKYLKSDNEEQKKNIDRLKKEIEVRKEVFKDERAKALFLEIQETKLKNIKETEITLDKIEKEIQNEKDTVTDNDFTSVRM